MKNTYDKKDVKFCVNIGDYNYDFDSVYGYNLKLVLLSKEQSSFDLSVRLMYPFIEQSSFNNITYNDEFDAFEDATEKYIEENFLNFDPIQRFHALAFLERYCMNYQEVKDKYDTLLRLKKNM